MSDQHPFDAAETPDAGMPGDAAHPSAADDDEALDITRLPTVLRESAWSRGGERGTVIDSWSGAFADADQPAGWRRAVRSGAAIAAIAAVLGGVAGALVVGSFRDGGRQAEEAVEALRSSIGQLASEVRLLKDGVGAGSQATAQGLAAIEERIAGAERTQASLTARIADLSEAKPSAISPEITGSVERPLPVADDWILWRVRNGRALVQGGGGYFEIVPGSALPGLGIVQRIVKQDGRWMVFTPGAVIVARS